MANQEHLDILKQGVEVWNKWRKEHPNIRPDLMSAHLFRARLFGAYLGEVNLNEAFLCEADLNQANLNRANLVNADLTAADLVRTDLSFTNLENANLSKADLSYANLNQAKMNGAKLNKTEIRLTVFGNIDLQSVETLGEMIHLGPSIIGFDTIIASRGNIPEIFLRKAGVPQSIIEQIPFLLGSLKPIDYYSCFISYSSKDEAFAKRLYADLQSNNVRCWFAPEDLKIGDKFWHCIDESIRLYDKLLVVLSEHSVQSDWVEREVMAALEKEKQGKTVLFPITLDDAVKDCIAPWAADIRRSRHIGDFRRWKNHDDYQQAFARLLRDLKASS